MDVTDSESCVCTLCSCVLNTHVKCLANNLNFYLVSCLFEGVDHVFDNGLGLLHMACISQNFAAVQFLVAAGADVNIRDTQG